MAQEEREPQQESSVWGLRSGGSAGLRAAAAMEKHVFDVARLSSKRRARRSGPRWSSSPSERVPRRALVERLEALALDAEVGKRGD
jgi:hypothetical protein